MDEEMALRWVKGAIRSEMSRRDMTFADLAERLRGIGVDENERNLRNKVARGTFSALFFAQCLEAIGVRSLRIDLLEFLGQPEVKPDHRAEVGPASKEELEEMERVLARVRGLMESRDD